MQEYSVYGLIAPGFKYVVIFSTTKEHKNLFYSHNIIFNKNLHRKSFCFHMYIRYYLKLSLMNPRTLNTFLKYTRNLLDVFNAV